MVTYADKGNITVVMNREDYHSKMIEILENKDEYEKQNTDPFYSLDKNMNSINNKLNKKKYLTETHKKLFFKTHLQSREYMVYQKSTKTGSLSDL